MDASVQPTSKTPVLRFLAASGRLSGYRISITCKKILFFLLYLSKFLLLIHLDPCRNLG